MAVNEGVAPPDLTSPVGKFRALIGDVEYEDLDPPVPGKGSYKKFSDIEIEGFLLVANGSVESAIGFAYLQLASSAAEQSKSVQDFDLKIDLTKRAADLRAIAEMWFERGDLEGADIFELFDTAPNQCGCVPEATPWPVCRRGCSGYRLFG